IVLAAGYGRRMRPLTEHTHKTLLEVGGRTVIRWLVDSLLENGVHDMTVVTGYRARGVEAHLASVYPGLPVRFVHNPRLAETNNSLSLALAFEHVPLDDDVVLLECDLVCEPAVMRRLLESPHRTVALVDRWRTGMGGRAAVDRRPRSRGRACHPSSRRRPR